MDLSSLKTLPIEQRATGQTRGMFHDALKSSGRREGEGWRRQGRGYGRKDCCRTRPACKSSRGERPHVARGGGGIVDHMYHKIKSDEDESRPYC